MEEKREIKVSLKEAKSWYYGTNDTLKTLALQAYTKEELEEIKTYNNILKSSSLIHEWIECPSYEFFWKLKAIVKLKIIANYYNKNWKKTDGETGYFLKSPSSINETAYKGVAISRHLSVTYPMIYFKTYELAIKAINLLTKEELNLLMTL